jgi:hypothetical protein
MTSKQTKHIRKYNRSITAYASERGACAGSLRIIGALLLIGATLLGIFTFSESYGALLLAAMPILAMAVTGALFIAACYMVEAFFDIADCHLRNAYREFYKDETTAQDQ